MAKPKVWYLPTLSHTEKVFEHETYKRLLNRFEVTVNPKEASYTSDQVAEGIAGFDALVTGWGTPALTGKVFERADALRMIAHSAGSVKGMLSPEIVERYIMPRKICVFSANHAIAYNVAESTVGLLIMASHRFMQHAWAVRHEGAWRKDGLLWNGRFLGGSTVGVVSASKVGREVIRMLRVFDAKILVYDPYLSDCEAGRMDVEKVGLDELFSRSDHVTVHAPMIPETEKMIGQRQLGLLRDGATLVNTSRGAVIDHDALLKELSTGRLVAALDVTDPEPLAPDSPFRKLPNVIITPHISGAGYYGYYKIGEDTLRALEDFFAGKPVEGAVEFEAYESLA